MSPLTLSFDVDCSVEHAFTTWTSRIAAWWPPDHTIGGGHVTLDGTVGGRIVERAADGTEHVWGEITDWDPPSTLGYLWHLGRDRSDATQVRIRFSAAGSSTRVEVEHTGWEVLGSEAADWRERTLDGWSSLVPHFQQGATA